MATLVVPGAVPSPREDAEKIRNAVQGFGTDEKVVIAILGHRNAEQRKQIRKAYEELYNEDLIKRLESELKGDLERAVYRWIHDPVERDAIIAHSVLKTLNRDFKVIIEIATELSPDELFAVKRAYQNHYKTSLEEDVAAHASGDLRKILVALVSTYRYNGSEVNIHLAASEAKVLHKVIEEKELNHEEVTRILSTRSKAQLNATFNSYRDNNGLSISKKLVGEGEPLRARSHNIISRVLEQRAYSNNAEFINVLLQRDIHHHLPTKDNRNRTSSYTSMSQEVKNTMEIC